MSYFLVTYDNAAQFVEIAQEQGLDVYLAPIAPSNMRKAWFAMISGDAVSVHEWFGPDAMMKDVLHSFDISPVYGDYEYVK